MPHVENPLRGRLPGAGIRAAACGNAGFQWAPTLGGECYCSGSGLCDACNGRFQWAPTLGGECYRNCMRHEIIAFATAFQWAPTLGGECYVLMPRDTHRKGVKAFQWAPTLGGECYPRLGMLPSRCLRTCFNGHPPLGVNATQCVTCGKGYLHLRFQWAPTLGGECYIALVYARRFTALSFNGHPPLGVNATSVA